MRDLTKKKLSDSLMQVLKNKPLDKITISDLTSVCGVNRQTFYYHFHDIYDLIDWIYLTKGEEAIGEKRTYSTWQEGLTEIMKLMRNYRDFVLQTFHSRSRDHLQQILLKSSSRMIKKITQEVSGGKLNPTDEEFIADFYKYAFTGIVLEWIDRGMKEDPSVIVKHMDLIVHGNIRDAAQRLLQND